MADGLPEIGFGSEKSKCKIGEVEVACYILNNGTYLLSKNGVQKALGYDGKSPTWFADTIKNIRQFPFFLNLIQDPNKMLIEIIPYKNADTAAYIPPKFFMQACSAIVQARKKGNLNLAQLKISRKAEEILLKFDEEIICRLIDEATGFKFEKEAAISSVQRFLLENTSDISFQWIKTFPDNFFIAIFKMHQTEWRDLKNHPNVVGKIIYEVVFCRLSEECLADLRTTAPKRAYKRTKNLAPQMQHQQLWGYLNSVFALLEASGNHWHIFLQLLNRAYPKNQMFLAKYPLNKENYTKRGELSAFNAILKKLA